MTHDYTSPEALLALVGFLQRAAEASQAEEWLTTDAAAALVGIKPARLRHLLKRGAGPPRYRLSPKRFMYKPDEVIRWGASEKVYLSGRAE